MIKSTIFILIKESIVPSILSTRTVFFTLTLQTCTVRVYNHQSLVSPEVVSYKRLPQITLVQPETSLAVPPKPGP